MQKADFNSYGSRRGNHDVMMRGTFANVRDQEPDDPGRCRTARGRKAGSRSSSRPGEKMFIYDAAMKLHRRRRRPRSIFARRGVRHRIEP